MSRTETAPIYLVPTFFLNYDDPDVDAFAQHSSEGGATPREKAILLLPALSPVPQPAARHPGSPCRSS